MKNNIDVFYETLSAEQCSQLINSFESETNLHKGVMGGGVVDAERKDSTDLTCNKNDDKYATYNNIILPRLSIVLTQYMSLYPFLKSIMQTTYVFPYYNIQRYKEGEGYHLLHCEHYAYTPTRVLSWIIYLNDAASGTEFPEQKVKVKAVEGSCLVFPSFWTHPHKGITPNKGNKYIISGWVDFIPKENLKII